MRTRRAGPDVRTLLNKGEKATLRRLIEHIEQETNAEVCVMLLGDVENPRQFAVHYFNHMGIGKKDLDNGLLVLVALERRQIEIVVGKGLEEVVPRPFLEQVINAQMAPRFRDGDYGRGLHEAVDALGQRLRASFPRPGPGRPGKIPDVVDLDQRAPYV
jgi:uncharacterized protein